MIQPGAPAPEVFAGCAVKDAEGVATTLGQVWAERTTLLYFVRHFGCIGCSESLARLRPVLGELQRLEVQVVLVGCGSPRFIPDFLERHHLLSAPLRCVTDETLSAHQLAGLAYGPWGGWGPRGLFEQARAFLAGHQAGPVQGDPHQQAGAVLIDAAGRVRWVHRNRSLGDHASMTALLGAVLASWADAHPQAL
jgi:peroxiredoxin